jgi:hypothetical protein
MKKFILKVLLYLLPIVMMAYVFDYVITSGLRKSRYNDYAVWNDIYAGQINADVIINGSSRAMVQLSPAIMDSVLQVNSYNIGFNGYGFLMQLLRNDIYRKHNHKPRMIIHEVDYGTFGKRDDLYENFQFFPYLDDVDLRSELSNYKGLNFFDYNVPLIRYYSYYKIVGFGVAEFFGLFNMRGSKVKGYQANSVRWDGSFEEAKASFANGFRAHQDSTSVVLFEEYIKSNKSDSIEVVLVWMPEYIEGQKFVLNRDSVLNYFENLAGRHDLLFFNYSQDTICHSKDFFYNSRHLNKKGAEYFSRKFASDLNMKTKHFF